MNTQPFFPTLTNMLDEVFGSETLDHVAKRGYWNPPANIHEDETKFTIEISSPGFAKNDFEINLEERRLTVSSKKEFNHQEEKANYTRREFGYRNFTRHFTLPKNVNTEKIEANYQEGILVLTLPKAEESKITKKIEIK